MKKKGPLHLPSTLQQELGLGGGGGAPSSSSTTTTTGNHHHHHHNKKKKTKPTSRKEMRKQERLDKKQRKASTFSTSKRPRAAAAEEAAGTTTTKRPRPSSSSSSTQPSSSMASSNQPPARKSLGLVARARGITQTHTSTTKTTTTTTKKKSSSSSSSSSSLASIAKKDPFIAAEEEELRYLERKLGLSGKDKKKKEDKLFRDLMKYEGFDDSICDLIRATDHISEVVAGGGGGGGSSSAKAKKIKEKKGEKKKEEEKKMKEKKKATSKVSAVLTKASSSSKKQQQQQDEEEEEEEGPWDYEADLGSGEEEDMDGDEEDSEDDEWSGDEREEERDLGGVPDFLDSDGEEPMEVEILNDGEEEEDDDEEEEEEESGSGSQEEEEEEEEEEESGSGSGSGSEEEQSGSSQEESDDDDDEDEEHDSKEVAQFAYHPVAGEDIYGRPTNQDTAAGGGGKYIPPHLRKKQALEAQDDTSSADYQLLRKVMNGIANRLSEQNLEPSIRDVRALYASHPSQRVNTLLTDTLLRLCVSSTQIMKSLIPAYAGLVAGAHFAGGGGVGAFVLERVCREYDGKRKRLAAMVDGNEEEEEEEGVARELDNLVLLLAYLYAFGVVACGLVYELVRELLGVFGERDVELLLLILRTAGPQLRGDDPAALKDIVLAVQEKAAEVEAAAIRGGGDGGSAFNARVRHMLETINDLKNNKRRQAQVQDQDRTQRLRKVVQRARSSSSGGMGGGGGGGKGGETLHITWNDLRSSDERGRWWRVGASWVGKDKREGGQEEDVDKSDDDDDMPATTKSKRQASALSSSTSVEASLQAKMAKLAAKQRMNTDVRRAIFCAIMTATDYEDAFERLMRLNLNDQQEREIVRVLVDCAGQEAKYNPFYAYLAGRLCEYHDKYKFTLQLTFWDIFKLLDGGEDGGSGSSSSSSSSKRRNENLAETLCHLIAKGWLSLAVLKVVDVSMLGAGGEVFFKTFFTRLLDEKACPDKELLAALQRVGAAKDPLVLTETLTTFLHRFVLGKKREGGEKLDKTLRTRGKSMLKLLNKLSVMQFMEE